VPVEEFPFFKGHLMCFSATASFTTSGVLFITGVASLSKVGNRSQVMLASTPLLFGVQQLSEGLLWLNLADGDSYSHEHILTYFFVIFGQLVWPIWVPLANLKLEKQYARRKILAITVGLGSIISSYLAYQMLTNPVRAEIREHHIKYVFDYSGSLVENFNLTYLIPTVFSHFVSSIKKIQILGGFTLLAFLISKIYFTNYIFSVWCFFAAILSAWIFFTIRSINNEERKWFIQL
jgi:hypothetical protein